MHTLNHPLHFLSPYLPFFYPLPYITPPPPPTTQLKAYTTRVGAGPYPTEVFGQLAEELREIGKEYGTTTGRPRRIGWLDIIAAKYAVSVRARCVAS